MIILSTFFFFDETLLRFFSITKITYRSLQQKFLKTVIWNNTWKRKIPRNGERYTATAQEFGMQLN